MGDEQGAPDQDVSEDVPPEEALLGDDVLGHHVVGDDVLGHHLPADDTAGSVPTGPVDVHESFLHEQHPLHRPRHGRHVGSGVAALAFLLVPAVVFVLGVRPVAFENRALAPFPSGTQGWGFLGGLPLWASDHLPLRQQAVQAADGISQGVFGEPFPAPQGSSGSLPVGPAAPGQSVQGPAAGALTDPDSAAMTKAGFPIVIPGSDGWLYYGLDAYAACNPERPLADVWARLDRLRSLVVASGRTFELVVAPDKSSGAPEHLPDEYVGEACAAAHRDQFWDAVDGRSYAVDLRPALAREAETTGEPSYFPQDSHWSYSGGTVAARALAEVLQPGITQGWRTARSVEVEHESDLARILGERSDSVVGVPVLDTGDGHDEADLHPVDLHDLPVVDRAPQQGTVDVPTAVIGDSFVGFAWPALSAGFTQVQAMHLDTVGDNPTNAARVVAAQSSVVVMVAERTLASGRSPLFNDQFLDAVEKQLTR